jgi:hypothetical protein
VIAIEEISGREIIEESDKVVDKREMARQARTEIIAKGRAPHDGT